MQDTKNFKPTEFYCPCCEQEFMNDGFIERLQSARTYAGIPFHINSGWRCSIHNNRISGAYRSAHIRGRAADVRATDESDLFAIVKALLNAGFTRIGVAATFIHVDDDRSKPQRMMWTY